MGAYDTPGNAYGVVVSGRYAYVADGTGGLRVINVLTPTAPYQIGVYTTTVPTATAYGVTVLGDYAYVAQGAAGLAIVNIHTPTLPTQVGVYTKTLRGSPMV